MVVWSAPKRHNFRSKQIAGSLPETIAPGRQIWIDPRECTRMALIGGRLTSGLIQDGDWDFEAVSVADAPKIRACLAHWTDGVPWSETGIYEHLVRLIEKRGSHVDGCRTREEIIRRYERMDALYETIRRDGRVRTARELGRKCDPTEEPGGVVIHVGRGGEPFFSGSGHHRLAIAIALGLSEMPAMLGAVHPQALNVCSRMERKAVGYQTQRSTESKFNLIKSSIDLARVGSLLDIGCNEGQLTSMFHAEGVFCVGLDIRPHFLDCFNGSVGGSAFGVLPMTQEVADKLPPFDAILLLSVHHQWHKTLGEERTTQLVTTLANKANTYFVVEFSALAAKYGFDKAPFKDNDKKSIIKYATRWLKSLGVPGKVRYIGKNAELPGREPYRYSFVIEKRPTRSIIARLRRMWRIAQKPARMLSRPTSD